MIKATISEEWAASVQPTDVFRYNQFSAEDLLDEIDIRRMGGLITKLTVNTIFDQEVIANARSVRHIIDLSFGRPAIQTSTSLLLAAANSQQGYDSLLAEQLGFRNHQTMRHGSNEAWFLPVHGVMLTDPPTQDTWKPSKRLAI